MCLLKLVYNDVSWSGLNILKNFVDLSASIMRVKFETSQIYTQNRIHQRINVSAT